MPLRRVDIGRSLNRSGEATPLVALGRSREQPRGFSRGKGCEPTRRSGLASVPSSRKMPPTGEPPRWIAGARHAVGIRRRLPWGSDPFGVFYPGDRCTGLPRRYRPLSEFLTLSAVSSRLGLVALFRATSTPRILAFRALPAQPAVTPFGVRCSPVVSAGSGGLERARASPSPLVVAALPHLLLSGWRPPACPRSPVQWFLASAQSPFHRSEPGIGRAAKTADGFDTERAKRRIRVCERSVGASSGRLEPTTSERYSD